MKDGVFLIAMLAGLLLVAVLVVLASEYVKRKALERRLKSLADDMALTENAARLGYYSRAFPDGKPTWSAGMYAVFGRDPNSHIPTTSSTETQLLPGYLAAVDRVRDPALNKGRGSEEEIRIRRPDGSIRDVLLASRFLFDKNGKPRELFGVAVDITERRAAERAAAEELVRGQESLQLAMDASQAGYFDVDDGTGVSYWSPRALEIMGYGVGSKPTAADLPRIVHPDDVAEFLAEREEMRLHGRPLDAEFRVRHNKDGDYVWVHMRAIRRASTVGGAGRTIGIVRDVSQRRWAERAVADSEKKFRNLIEGSIQAILILDRTKPLFCNSACAKLLGYDTPEQFLIDGNILWHLVPEDAAAFGEHWIASMRGERDGVVRRRQLVDRRGGMIDVEIVGRCVQWDGRPVWQITMFDITERNRMEEALRASEEQFRQLSSNASDVIVVYDENDVVSYASPSVEAVSGYTPEDIIGGTGYQSIHPDDLPRLLERRRQIRQGLLKPMDALRWRLIHKDGSIRWIETTNALLPAKPGKAPQIRSSSRDITESVEHEVQLSAAHDRLEAQANDLAMLAQNLEAERERAERANAAKSQFLAMMSHELRTPMTGVLGMADLLLMTEMTAEQRDLTQLLTRSARMLLDLLNDILDFSKIEAGQLQIERTPLRLSEVVADVHNLFVLSAAEKGLVFESKVPATYWDHVIGDPKRLRQVLANLVNNAIKFTEKGSVRVDVSQRSDGGDLLVMFTVTDTGIGIAEADTARLFAPFIQADVSTSRRFGGTGLGLAICRRLVEAMGGVIDVDSRPGRGSTFAFTVRVARAAADISQGAEVRPELQAAYKADPRRILIAEDNDTSRYLISTMLQKHGHTVEAVENGARALEAVIAKDYDIVLMDMQMPVMDGPEATRAIRKLPLPKCGVPIIALTADIIAEHRKIYVDAGVNAVVGKPVDWLELEREIERCFKGDVVKRHVPVPAATTADEEGLVDDSALKVLAASIGGDVLADMIDSFSSNMVQYGDDLRAAHAGGNLKQCKRVAHALKGLSAQFGAPRVSALAREIEYEASDLDAILPLLPEIDRAVHATVAVFTSRKAAMESQTN